MIVVTRCCVLLATLCALCGTPTEGATLPARQTDGRQRPCPPPLRTLPDLNAIHGGKATFRPTRQFLREWCPPESPVVFPSRRSTSTVWGRDVANRFNGPNRINPHRGTAVEGGSIRITFPGQHITEDRPSSSSNRSSEEDDDLVEFINSKMHPSLLRPRGQRPRPRLPLLERRGASGGDRTTVRDRLGRL